MAAVVFGSGSPRHHHHHHGSSASNRAHRVHHSSNSVSHHHHHHQQQQSSSSSVVISPSSHHYGSATSPSQSSSATSTHHHIVAGGGGGGGYSNSGGNSSSSGTGHHNHNSPIIMPPASYLSTGTPMSSTSQHHSQYITHHSVPAPTATLAGTGAPSPPSHQHHHHHPHNHHTHHNHQPSVHYTQHHSLMYSAGRHHQQSKRKSAVELLAESKPFYVKSENVLDRHQQLNFRTIGTGSATQQGSSGGGGGGGGSGGAGGAGGGMVIISGNSNIDRISNGCGNSSGGGGAGAAGSNSISSGGNVCALMSPSRTNTGTGVVVGTHHTHHHHHRPANRRSASSSSDLLQTKLRKLLNTADSGKESQALSGPLLVERHSNETHKYDTFSKFQSVKYNQELSVHASNDQSELSVMFPSAFLSPQSLPPQPLSDEGTYCYKAGGGGGGGRMVGCSGMSTTEPLILTEDYRAISPPAEYAAVESSPDKEQSSRCNYQRSYSHSHDTTSDEHDYSSPSYNINSHKSLPDLHSQISRHSPHSEVLSCCSRGNRSNKSGGGSSLNRDSGGSSGHYTHRSEPCCKQQRERERERERESSVKMCLGVGNDYRRDSGSSTQHSGNSYYTYGMSLSRYADCPECKSKYQKDSECLLNFTTPEVPEAFQDDYPTATPPAELRPISRYYEESHYISQRKIYTSTPQHQSVQIQLQQQQTHHHTHKQTTATFQNHLYYQQQQQQQQPQQAHHHSPTTARTPDDSGVIVVIGGGPAALKEPELSPPPTAFKRQKCLRFKHRNRYSTSNDRCSNRSGGDHERDYSDDDRKPILRSKSDISDRYYNRGTTMIEQQPTAAGTAGGNGNGNNKNANGMEKLRRAESMSQLEKFFDRLGLNEEKFDEIYSLPKRRFSSDNDSDDSSTVFFSDVSTVDSTRLPDSTETQPQTSQTYRPTEPPSIVERNARIIKWLCNCRKLQLT